MKKIAVLTAGGDTPALNATLHGVVTRANQSCIEVIGLLRGFDSLFAPTVPHVRLNPLFATIPELNPNRGGTIIGSSRRYVDAASRAEISIVASRLGRLGVDGLICIGGDGTLNGMQAIAEHIPTVLAPKTIDNDLGLNYAHEADKWVRDIDASRPDGYRYRCNPSALMNGPSQFSLSDIVNYVTPGYATAVFVSVGGIFRVRTTAESHRRIAIVEVMGRHSGYLALGSAYGQPDIILVPEVPINVERLVERVKAIYDLQRNVVIVCGEGIVDQEGQVLGASRTSTDPAGNLLLSGAAERLRQILIKAIGDEFFQANSRNDSAEAAIFTRKVGHTQRGGRPLSFDRYYASQLGGKAVEMLKDGETNSVATLKWEKDEGFSVPSVHANMFRDSWGVIHARSLHPSFYDPERMDISPVGAEYLKPIFTNAIGYEDVEYIRNTRFDAGNLFRPYHSINVDMDKRVRYLEPDDDCSI